MTTTTNDRNSAWKSLLEQNAAMFALADLCEQAMGHPRMYFYHMATSLQQWRDHISKNIRASFFATLAIGVGLIFGTMFILESDTTLGDLKGDRVLICGIFYCIAAVGAFFQFLHNKEEKRLRALFNQEDAEFFEKAVGHYDKLSPRLSGAVNAETLKLRIETATKDLAQAIMHVPHVEARSLVEDPVAEERKLLYEAADLIVQLRLMPPEQMKTSEFPEDDHKAQEAYAYKKLYETLFDESNK